MGGLLVEVANNMFLIKESRHLETFWLFSFNQGPFLVLQLEYVDLCD